LVFECITDIDNMSPILLTILAIFLSLLAYILFVPIRLNLRLVYNESFIATSTFAFFPFTRTFTGETGTVNKPSPIEEISVEKPDAPPKPPKPGKKLDYSRINKLDRQIIYQTIKEAFRFVGKLLRAPDYYLQVNVVGGTEEPDVTGQLFGAYMAVRPMLPQSITIQYRPDFLMERFRGELNLGLSVRVYDIVREITVFLYRIPKIKLFKLYKKLKRSKDEQ
jgi:hypothetical protein